MPRVPPSTDDLLEADDALMRGLRDGAADALDALLDDEATLVAADGTTYAKLDLIDACRAGRWRGVAIEIERRRARVVGELGVVAALVRVGPETADAGAPLPTRERHTRTWRLGEAWTLVASHASPTAD